MIGAGPMPAAVAQTVTVSTGETVLFWVLAPIMVLGALGLLFSRRSVYAAMAVVLVMISLAVMYIAQGATFLGVAQVVVYTGAIMMLFLFVIMLVGVDASDSLHETIKGQRWVAGLAGLGLAALLAAVVLRVTMPAPAGLEAANADTNPVGVARLIFSDHVFAMELTGTLLITAAVGAVTFTHRERIGRRYSQEEVADAKMAAYRAGKGRLAQLPAPGVYARSNAADLPALSAEGEPLNVSVPRILRIRGQERTIAEISPETAEALARAKAGQGPGTHGADGTRTLTTARMPSMPGDGPPKPWWPGREDTDGSAELTGGERPASAGPLIQRPDTESAETESGTTEEADK
ncbi:NADH-quinone oxidoreductase subunit J [Georgenia halophila]|uniref:NADH-quinone oxidoreductase subunit J n=1 Tax=Georgenia halophila TaxID=620889 RepID=A0ABP8KXG8_9MICO